MIEKSATDRRCGSGFVEPVAVMLPTDPGDLSAGMVGKQGGLYKTLKT
jgi:hypothetical protein